MMVGPASFPAIRSHLGDWAYFNTVMPFREVAVRVRGAEDVHRNKGLDDMIQRALTDRSSDIATYIQTQAERFFNAIVLGIYGGEPNWFPVDIEEDGGEESGRPPLNLSHRARESLGVLQLSGTENLFAIDGQHRVEGIKEALGRQLQLGTEEIAVLFVAHRTTTAGLARTRRLFTTLNKYAKPVILSEIIALDEDDAFAVVTRMVVTDYEGLSPTVQEGKRRVSLVKFGQGRLPKGDRHSITAIDTLYKLISLLTVPRRNRGKTQALKQQRPSPEDIDSMYENHAAFWELLREHVAPMSEALGSNPQDEVAGRYRTDEGGHLLFRPVGQTTFAGAVRTLLDREVPLNEAVGALAQTEMTISRPPWTHVLWDPSRQSMARVNAELSESLFLHMVNHPPRRAKFDLSDAYSKAVGEHPLNLHDLPRVNGL